jgi:hypothetical protein
MSGDTDRTDPPTPDPMPFCDACTALYVDDVARTGGFLPTNPIRHAEGQHLYTRLVALPVREDEPTGIDRLTIENDLIERMFAAIKSADPMLKEAVPGTVLEHVYSKVYSQLATMAENARKAREASHAR